jgi:hypothetical protein
MGNGVFRSLLKFISDSTLKFIFIFKYDFKIPIIYAIPSLISTVKPGLQLSRTVGQI